MSKEPEKVKCEYCGKWGYEKTNCKGCGHPLPEKVDEPEWKYSNSYGDTDDY